MDTRPPTRDEAFWLLKEFNHTDKAIKHALAVEATMRHFARKRNHDEEKWGLIGLIHDLDYEQFPAEHCTKTREILTARNYPPDYIHAVLSHGFGLCSEVEPTHEMEKVLFAIDELTGLVSAAALVRPSKSILDLEVKSVKKKWKEKSFAAGVDRSVIERGAAMLDTPVDSLIAEVIEALRGIADTIGLGGV
ncbi:MAG: HD domain-containing protein [Planctomycetota bacterium]|nr:HD domain-containing protein [Planctomycetota bacterium]